MANDVRKRPRCLRTFTSWLGGVGLVMLLAGGTPRVRAAEVAGAATGEQAKFFETKVRPLLVEHCLSCHGEKKQKGGLRLDTAAGVKKGGKNGAVVLAGKPGESKLVVAVKYADADLQMPPDEEGRLSAEQVGVLARWVEMGAPWPGDRVAEATLPGSKKRVITEGDRAFWSFQTPREVVPPAVTDGGWSRSPVDRFVFAKLAAEGLAPAPVADKATLVRRAYLDVHGVPPTVDEVKAFVEDTSENAWENLVDRLLASPRYGERMARHWMDLVRYAESDGYRQDAYRPNAWPYRDYLIKSFNADKPYDRFVREQLAGDEIAPEDPEVLVATGFLRHGSYEYNQRDVRQHWQTIVDEVVDVTADAFLGLSMGCAKCHDHKFDPILQSDYYRLEAFFAAMLPRNDLVLATPAEKEKHAAALKVWRERTAGLRAQIDPIEAPFIEKTAKGAIGMFPQDIQDIIHKPAKDRTPYEEQIAQLSLRQVYGKTESGDAKVTGPEREKHLELVRALGAFDDVKPKPLLGAFVATDVGPVAPPTYINGSADRTPQEPGYPVVLDGKGLAVPAIEATATSTGRRTALANWLTQPNHPLTARVIVNRVWQYHFGRGLVATSSDYGKIGDRPSHPELLDYLARRLVDGGWSLKEVHRLILTSSTYRQSSAVAAAEGARLKDPENRWLWKFPARRLDAEQIRDAMLAVSGELKGDMYGPGVDPVTPRRAVYTKAIRNVRDPLLDAFDLPDASGSAADRNRTTTATQSLLMFNGDAPLKRAEMFAGRLKGMGLKTPEETVRAAWEIAYSRPPAAKELGAAVAFLKQSAGAVAGEAKGGDAAADGKAPTSIDEKPIVKQMPQLGSQAVYVRNARADDVLRLPSPSGMPTDDLTVEAYVYLDSLYEDASVRTIASQWSGKQDQPGWSFGVTSARSRYEPQNLILQLTCDPKKPGGGYEVIASDFRIELHKTYYVAVSLNMKDMTETGVTFYLKDVGDMDAPLKTVSVRHKLSGTHANGAAVMVGGRDSSPNHGWDGLIDEVRISRKVLKGSELLYNEGTPPAKMLAAHWTFEDRPGLFKDSAAVQGDLVKPKAKAGGKGVAAARTVGGERPDAALVDLCHVILNSNRFLYLE